CHHAKSSVSRRDFRFQTLSVLRQINPNGGWSPRLVAHVDHPINGVDAMQIFFDSNGDEALQPNESFTRIARDGIGVDDHLMTRFVETEGGNFVDGAFPSDSDAV